MALKLAGVDAGEATRAYIRREGGIARTRIFTKAFLALLGQWPWHAMVNVPVELILAPPGAPLSVYDFACWARQTLVPLSVVMALKPVRPAGIDLSEIGARPGRNRRPARQPGAAARDPGRRAVGARAAGGGRLLGRDPAAVGLVAADARRARPQPRGRVLPPRDRRLGRLHDRRGRPAAPRGVPVAGLGHGPRRARAARRGRPRRPPAARQGRRVAVAGGDHGSRATGRCAGRTSPRAAGPSSTRTTSIPTSTTPR